MFVNFIMESAFCKTYLFAQPKHGGTPHFAPLGFASFKIHRECFQRIAQPCALFGDHVPRSRVESLRYTFVDVVCTVLCAHDHHHALKVATPKTNRCLLTSKTPTLAPAQPTCTFEYTERLRSSLKVDKGREIHIR